MKTLHDAAARAELIARLERLSPDAPAQWGKFTATRMVAHLADSLRMASGELQCRSKRLPIRFTPLKEIIVYLAPFPKNAPTAPELISREPAAHADEVAALRAQLEQFAAWPAGKSRPEHPAFGRLSDKQWGVLGYRHSDHHLRQFGV